MGKIRHKDKISDNTEGVIYRNKDNRKVYKKVGHKGDYSDINMSSAIMESIKSGEGTSTNPYVHTVDIKDSFINNLSSQKSSISDMKERINLQENLINKITEDIPESTGCSKGPRPKDESESNVNRVIVFQVDLKRIINHSKENSVKSIFNRENKKIICDVNNIGNRKEKDKYISTNNSFSIVGLDVNNINIVKYTLVLNNERNVTSNISETDSGSSRLSKDNVYNISKKLDVNIHHKKDMFYFSFQDSGMTLSTSYLFNYLKKYISSRGEAYIQFYVEYN